MEPVSSRTRSRAIEIGIYMVALVALLGLHARMGLSLDEDSYTYLLWGRDLTSGMRLNQAAIVAPKVLPILLAAASQYVPGQRGPEYFQAAAAAFAGAGVVLLTFCLARRMGGTLAGLASVPLVLGHMQFVRYVTNGQSSIYASLTVLGVLLLATREETRVRDYLWAAFFVFIASLWRPEMAVLGGALGLALWLRLGWQRIGWPALIVLVGVASGLATMAFCQAGFGSFGYGHQKGIEWTLLINPPQPNLHIGFAIKVVKTLFYYASKSWVLLLFAGVGVGLLLSRDGIRRYASLALFPLATAAFTWLLLAPGTVFPGQPFGFIERCYYYVTFIIIALAAAAIGRLASWAGSSEEFMGGLPSAWRTWAFAAVALAFVAPVYLSRPLPERGAHNQALERAFAYLKDQLPESPRPRIVVPDDMSYLFYRLKLPADECSVSAIRILKAGDGALPADVEWGVIDEKSKPVDFPPKWGLKEVWADKTGEVRIYRRQTQASGI